MSKKYKIIALFGKSGSGKTYTLNKLLELYPDFNRVISNTTRPKRDREVEDVDYHFVSDAIFNTEDYLETSSYNQWSYGTPMSSLDKKKINIAVFDLQGIKTIIQDERVEVLPVHILTSDKTRIFRCLNREDNPNVLEICRRFLADEKEYEELKTFPKNTICVDDVKTLIKTKEFLNFL